MKTTSVLTAIIETTQQKRIHLDQYPGTRERRDSRVWTEQLKNLEEKLYSLWESRRLELSRMRKDRREALEAAITR